ncbi:MAG: AMP-binding protein, partial [Beijerinckiaceae bacterium]
MSNHLFDLIRLHAGAPGKTFIEREDGSIVTYGDLLSGSARVANALLVAGVKPGDRVAVQVEKSAEAI